MAKRTPVRYSRANVGLRCLRLDGRRLLQRGTVEDCPAQAQGDSPCWVSARGQGTGTCGAGRGPLGARPRRTCDERRTQTATARETRRDSTPSLGAGCTGSLRARGIYSPTADLLRGDKESVAEAVSCACLPPRDGTVPPPPPVCPRRRDRAPAEGATGVSHCVWPRPEAAAYPGDRGDPACASGYRGKDGRRSRVRPGGQGV